MNVLCITSSPNLGMYRLMKILSKRGYNIILLYQGNDYKTAYGLDLEMFKFIYKFPNRRLLTFLSINKSRLLLNEIAVRHKINLIYSVNINNDFLSYVASSLRRYPVIYNVVDIHSLMSYPITLKYPIRSIQNIYGRIYANYLEKQTYKLSAGYVFSTENMKQTAILKYQINSSNSIVISNYLPQESIVTQGQTKLSQIDNELHLVYEGVIAMTGHGYILPTILRIAKQNIHIHLYCNQKPNYYVNKIDCNPYIHWEKLVKPNVVTYELTKYDYGLMAYNDIERRHLDTVLPNKLFDFLAAGLPVITPPFKSLKYFIENNSVGIVVENMDNLMNIVGKVDYSKLIFNVLKVRQNLTIESKVEDIINLFERVLNNCY